MEQFNRLTLNVGGGLEFSRSLREMTMDCQELTGRSIEFGSEALERRADLRIYVTDNRNIESVCGWKPLRGPAVVLKDTLDWIAENQEQVGPALFAPAS
jgi:CDP-paratose 2-epimerase